MCATPASRSSRPELAASRDDSARHSIRFGRAHRRGPWGQPSRAARGRTIATAGKMLCRVASSTGGLVGYGVNLPGRKQPLHRRQLAHSRGACGTNRTSSNVRAAALAGVKRASLGQAKIDANDFQSLIEPLRCGLLGRGWHEAARVYHAHRRRGVRVNLGARAAEAADHRIPGLEYGFGHEPMGRRPSCSGCASLAGSRAAPRPIEYRWAESRPERFVEIAAEFARLKVDVICHGMTPNASPRGEDRRHRNVPIVFATGEATPSVQRAWLQALARPGGNVTGLSTSGDRHRGQAARTHAASSLPSLRRRAMIMRNAWAFPTR